MTFIKVGIRRDATQMRVADVRARYNPLNNL